MLIVALSITAILIVLSAIHLLWAVGFWFPIREESDLVQAVVGFKSATRMPGAIPCALVSLALLATCIVILWPDSMLRTAFLSIATLVLLFRGGMSYLPFWRKLTPLEPFATYDHRFYGPLCLTLAVGLFLVL